MIGTFIAVFVVLMLVVLGMAVGVLNGRAPLKGSCGGLGAVGVERACGCTDVCANEAAEQEKAAAQADSKAAPQRYTP